MNLLSSAVGYALSDWSVLPVRGKLPLTGHGFKDAATSSDQITAWWGRNPDAGIGIATGAVSGIWVLDIDGEAGFESLRDLELRHGALPRTPTVITPGGGEHHYFQYDEPVGCSAGALGPGLDVRADGGYVVAPPSVHPNGGLYEWASEAHVDDIPIAVAPGWLIQLAQKKRHVAAQPPDGLIPEGARNTTFASLAGAMRRQGASETAIAAALTVENDTRCNPPLSEREILQITHSIGRYEPTAGAVAKPITVKVR